MGKRLSGMVVDLMPNLRLRGLDCIDILFTDASRPISNTSDLVDVIMV